MGSTVAKRTQAIKSLVAVSQQATAEVRRIKTELIETLEAEQIRLLLGITAMNYGDQAEKYLAFRSLADQAEQSGATYPEAFVRL